jgi:small subunit ribosomal protein S20
MPHHKSAVKRVKTNKRDQNRNTAIKSQLKTMLKNVSQELDNKKVVSEMVSSLDRAARKGVIPKTVANRRKSRLARAANRLRKVS